MEPLFIFMDLEAANGDTLMSDIHAFFIRMVFFRLSLSILKFFQKMSLEYSYHILSTHLAPGLNTSLNILTTGIFLTKEYTFTN